HSPPACRAPAHRERGDRAAEVSFDWRRTRSGAGRCAWRISRTQPSCRGRAGPRCYLARTLDYSTTDAQESTTSDSAGAFKSIATPLVPPALIGVMPALVVVETLSPVGTTSWYLPAVGGLPDGFTP